MMSNTEAFRIAEQQLRSMGVHEPDALGYFTMRWVDYLEEVRIQVVLEHDKLSPRQRRRVKRHCKLEVPDWAVGSAQPPLEGTVQGEGWHLELTLQGAFQCTQVGEEEVEPSQALQERAAELESLTAEEALARVRDEAAGLRQPTVRPRWRCSPAQAQEDE
jgi:hypothetical protein